MVRVCIIDDNADLLETFRLVFEDAGYEVLEAADGQEGLALVRASLESLVVLFDYKMPRLNGSDFLEAIGREPDVMRRHAFLFLTASNPGALPPTLAELLCRHGVPLIAKPFDLDQLLEAVEDAARRLS